jgi:SAM-dependent methyltransferase
MTQLRELYENRFSGAAQDRLMVWQVLTREYFQRWVPKQGTVLELGAGHCEFINSIEAKRKLALDMNPSTPELAAPGVEVIAQDVATEWPVALGSVDVIFTSNFFEHLPTKDVLLQCMSQAFRALRPGGRLIALGPNIRFCGDIYWDFIDHHLPLSDRSLSEGLQLAGFSIERVVPQFLPFTMTGRKPRKIALQTYLRLPFVWRFFGKQFLVIAKKEG